MKEVTVEDLGLQNASWKFTDKQIFDCLQKYGYIDADAVFIGENPEDGNENSEKSEDNETKNEG